MVIVTTKEELEKALENEEPKIVIQGDLASKIVKRKKVKKGALIGGLGLTAVGIVLLPFTSGASSGIVVHGLTVTAGTTAVTITTAEVAIIMGVLGITASTALLKNYKVVVKKDSVEMTNKRIE